MDYKIIRTSRRTVALVIDRRGDLVVRAPRRASLSDIERFILQKQDWIREKSRAVLARRAPARQFLAGERFLFLGQEKTLRITDEYRSKLYYDGEFELSRHKTKSAKAQFENWYRGQAKQLLSQRAGYYAQKMGVKPERITITGANTRWGSCSAKKTLNFSWRLVMAPLEIIDYVVVHELAHLVHHNHSQNFWRKVAEFFPGFREARKWLNTHGHQLAV